MKNGVTLKQLMKLSGRKGEAMGSEEACIYFDGQQAIAANTSASLAIDYPVQLSAPVLVPVSDLKAALLSGPTLQFQESAGELRINGVRVGPLPVDVIPDATHELLGLDRSIWYPVVRPFRLDGQRLRQVMTAMGVRDVRFYLNGLFLDFSSGAMVGVDGRRMHLVEDILPICDLPPDRLQGMILPAHLAAMLATLGGLQEVFVMEKAPNATLNTGYQRVICVGTANARFRIREIATDTFPKYRVPFERNRELPNTVVLDALSIKDILAVAAVAETNGNHPVVTMEGQGRRIYVSHQERFRRELPARSDSGKPFSVNVRGAYLRDALAAASLYGAAVRMRFGSGEDARGIYVGAQDFHAVVAAMRDEDESAASVTDAAIDTTTAA